MYNFMLKSFMNARTGLIGHWSISFVLRTLKLSNQNTLYTFYSGYSVLIGGLTSAFSLAVFRVHSTQIVLKHFMTVRPH